MGRNDTLALRLLDVAAARDGGYCMIGTRSVEETHSHLAPLLARPCDLLVYEKPLRAPAGLPAEPRSPDTGTVAP